LRATDHTRPEHDLVVRTVAEAVVEFRIGIKESP
jgi:hypothetical protein